MQSVLFLCTGNYYRSRFAEYYFKHLAAECGLDWDADSRGLLLDAGNTGPMSRYTLTECQREGICTGPDRLPMTVTEEDLQQATLVIAVKQSEHRSLMERFFPHWVDRIHYWEVHDIDVVPPSEAIPVLRRQVEELVEILAGRLVEAG